MGIRDTPARGAAGASGKTSTTLAETLSQAPLRRANSGRRKSVFEPAGSWVIPDDTRSALERCELFLDFSRDQLMQVAALVEERALGPDEKLLTEGAPASHVMVVVDGQAVAQLKLNQGWISLGLVGPNEVAGWSALLEGQVYPASVMALTRMKVACIETSGLTLLMNLDPAIGYPIHRRLSRIFFRQYQDALQAIRTSV